MNKIIIKYIGEKIASKNLQIKRIITSIAEHNIHYTILNIMYCTFGHRQRGFPVTFPFGFHFQFLAHSPDYWR